MKIAIVHDYLTQYGGAERVVATISEMFPDAPIYTIFYDPSGTLGQFSKKKIIESSLARIPLIGKIIQKKYQLFFWLLPYAIEKFDFRDYDLIISSSATFAKGIIANSALHICYCHTPTRYLWDDIDKYVSGFYANSFVKFFAKIFLNLTRRWDLEAAKRPDIFIANSRHIAKKIEKIYGRKVRAVIYPPVDISWWKEVASKFVNKERKYFLMVGRILKYKRFDIGIELSRRFGIRLKIVGKGRELARLKKNAPNSVEFLGWLPDEKLAELYANAKALLMPQEEDFGIVAIEALSCGTPVISYKRSGAAEIVKDGENGILVEEQSPEAFFEAICNLENLKLDPEKISASVEHFSKERFKKELMQIIEEAKIKIEDYEKASILKKIEEDLKKKIEEDNLIL